MHGNSPATPRPHERALVLGGGGSVGNAWLIGVIAGLFEAGLDVTGADLVIGASAGSTAAAQIAAASTLELFAAGRRRAARPLLAPGPVRRRPDLTSGSAGRGAGSTVGAGRQWGRPAGDSYGGQPVVRDEAVVGCTGSVVLAIGGPDEPGEVYVSVRGGGEAFLAYAPEELAIGTPVLVIDTRGERTVDVIAWQPPLSLPPV